MSAADVITPALWALVVAAAVVTVVMAAAFLADVLEDAREQRAGALRQDGYDAWMRSGMKGPMP